MGQVSAKPMKYSEMIDMMDGFVIQYVQECHGMGNMLIRKVNGLLSMMNGQCLPVIVH